MKLIARLLTLILGLLTITLFTVIMVAPNALADFLNNFSEVNFVLRLIVALLIDLVILALVYTRLRPEPAVTEGLVVKAPGAIADVTTDSARGLILSAVEQVPEVVSATADVKAIEGKADIELYVSVAGNQVNLPKKQQEINRALKQVVNKQLGLVSLGRPRVHITLHDEQRPAGFSVTPPRTPPASAPRVETPAAVPASTPIAAPREPAPLPAPAANPPASSLPSESSDESQTETIKDKPSADARKDSESSDNWLKTFLNSDTQGKDSQKS